MHKRSLSSAGVCIRVRNRIHLPVAQAPGAWSQPARKVVVECRRHIAVENYASAASIQGLYLDLIREYERRPQAILARNLPVMIWAAGYPYRRSKI